MRSEDEVVALVKERDMYRCVIQALSQGHLTGVTYRPGAVLGTHRLVVCLQDEETTTVDVPDIVGLAVLRGYVQEMIGDLRNRLFSLTKNFDKLAWRLGALEVRRPQISDHGGPWAVPCDVPGGTGSPCPQDADKGTGSPPPRQPGSVCETKKVDAKTC